MLIPLPAGLILTLRSTVITLMGLVGVDMVMFMEMNIQEIITILEGNIISMIIGVLEVMSDGEALEVTVSILEDRITGNN
jgi:hypothetical protein